MDPSLRAMRNNPPSPTLLVGPSSKPNPRVIRAAAEPRRSVNTVMSPTARMLTSPAPGLTKKQQLEMEARRLLEQEDSWWQQGPMPENVYAATSPKDFKSMVVNASSQSTVVGYFFSPRCLACKSLWPKLKQIASNNSDVTFVKLNTAEKALAELAEGLQVPKLPWFIIFNGQTCEQIASFTANLNTVSTLRAEIAGAKQCTAPQCAQDWSWDNVQNSDSD